jgi:hypothetical protein
MRAFFLKFGHQRQLGAGIAKIIDVRYTKQAIVACDGKLSPWGSIFLFTLLAPREYFSGASFYIS